MPVTAKLSKLFYERFGDQLVNELVDWFNAMDATYRADLREFNELNFARFDAKLEQRLAQLDAKIEVRIAGVNARIDGLQARFDGLEARFDGLEARFDGVAMKADLGGFASKADLGAVASKADLMEVRAELMKWMFVYWTGTVLAGLLLRAL